MEKKSNVKRYGKEEKPVKTHGTTGKSRQPGILEAKGKSVSRRRE